MLKKWKCIEVEHHKDIGGTSRDGKRMDGTFMPIKRLVAMSGLGIPCYLKEEMTIQQRHLKPLQLPRLLPQLLRMQGTRFNLNARA